MDLVNNQNVISVVRAVKLKLSRFRNYLALDIIADSQYNNIIITGPNGSGKTNILEAISLLVPGRGIRSCKLSDINSNLSEEIYSWYLSSEIESFYGPGIIETWCEGNEENKQKRFVRVNNRNIKNHVELSKLISVSWITPQMDQLFIGGTSIRRQYMDRIVQNFELNHAKHLIKYGRYMQERAKLLKGRDYDVDWIRVLENNMAQIAVLIATSRVQVIEYIGEVMSEIDHPFPKARMVIAGELESKIHKLPAVQLEGEFSEVLSKNRYIDMLTGRTNAGVHKSDLLVYYITKNLQADKCSTGEQKSLLLSVFLAEVFAQIKWRQQTPILLLDEVFAHLDEKRRDVLCQIIQDTKAQTWITGTDNEIFGPIRKNSQFFKIENSQLLSV